MIDPCPLPIHHWWQWHPPVGLSIAILGGLGVLVPWLFRSPEQVKARREKAVWTFVMLFFVSLEIHALYSDRDEHDAEQAHELCDQRRSFENIADGINTAISTSQTQFGVTMDKYSKESAKENEHFERLLGEEGHIFKGMQTNTQETLDALTGGSSYAAVMPIWTSDAASPAEFPLMVGVTGKNTMYDVAIEMQEGPVDVQYMVTHTKEYFEGKVRRSFRFAALSTTYSQPLGQEIHPDPQKVNEYNFWVFSLNQMTYETLRVKFDPKANRWASAFKVTREGVTLPLVDMDFDGKVIKQPQK